MPQSPSVTFNEVDLTFAPNSPAVGITLFIGSCRRGPIGKPDQIFTSWEAYRKVHGGLIAGNNFPTGVKRALERGSAVRICNVKHYSSISAGTLDGVKASAAASSLVSLSTALIAGVTLSVTVNGNTKNQLFSVSHENTIALLCTQLKTLTAIVEDAFSLGNNSLIIIPKAGVVLTTTSSATGTGAPTITVATESTIEDSANNTLFSLAPKYIGADYNNLLVRIGQASNGDVDAWNLYFDNLAEPDLSERYENLKIIGNPTVAASTYLAAIANSQYFQVTYSDLSAIVASQINPRRFAIRYQSGTDGGAIVDSDYIGDSASKTGLYSADQYGDASQLCVPEISSISVLQAGSAYAAARKDIQYFGYLGNFTTESALATARDNTLIDSKYCQLYAQNIVIVNPFDSNTDINISPLYDVCGAADYSDGVFGPWMSFAGTTRGLIYNAKGVVTNFYTPGNRVNLDLISNRQVNIIANDGGVIHILGNFTSQRAYSQYSFGNVTRFIIYLKKTLGPYIKTFLEEPCDIPTWLQMYLGAVPTLNNFAAKRALHGEENVGWKWMGDQFARDINDLKINNANDVGLGKYRLRLFLKVVVAMQEVAFDIILTPSGVSFEDALDIVAPTN